MKIEKTTDEYFTERGHIKYIFSGTKRFYGKNVRFKVESLVQKSLSPMSNYRELYARWKESDFDLSLTPMISKGFLNHPYTIDNVFWTTFGQTGLDQQKLMQAEMETYLEKFRKYDLEQKAKEKKEAYPDVQTQSSR